MLFRSLSPRAAYDPIAAQLQTLSAFNEHARWWQRLVIGMAEPLELDAQGRFLISPTLRKFASLNKDVTFVGQGNRFEIWDTNSFEAKLEGALERTGSSPPPGMSNFSL